VSGPRVIVPVSSIAVKAHLFVAFEALHRHRDRLGDVGSRPPEDAGDTLGQALAALQQQLIGELRWLHAIAPGIDSGLLLAGDGQRPFLKRYGTEIAYLAGALKAAVDAGPVSADHDRAAHASGWTRVTTGIVRLLALEAEARQL
jgi:hypothetical protein